MSIVIKGMEMPKDGRRHKALVIFEPDGTCKIVCEYSESYSERHIKTFEAIELPPHGRLIDADALHKLFEEQWHYYQVLNWDENPKAEAMQSGVNWCINTMHDNAPTILEAEEKE